MNATELTQHIRSHFPHTPTPEQWTAIGVFARFLLDASPQACMVLRGSAGTGKTTLAAAIVQAMTAMRQKLVLLAPTGRAAKVFSLYAGHNAYTIHRRIYRQKTAAMPMAEMAQGAFQLNDNLHRDTLFIVDEASMIAATGGDSAFGSGSVLDDLLRFVYMGAPAQQGGNCRLLLIGDQAQLPPVGEEQSPALQAQVLSGYGLLVYEATLSEVLRQSSLSGILWNATNIRQEMQQPLALPKMRLQGFADIVSTPGNELIEALASSYSHVGVDQTMVVTRSNKRANIYNRGIRSTVLDREEELCRGDELMIVKNNYFWLKDDTDKGKDIGFLANGDRCVVQRVRHIHELYGFRFAEVTLQLPDYDDYEITVTTLLDTLSSEAPALTSEQQTALYERVMADYADIPLKQDRMKALRNDHHYQALQVKFAYAVTCHKAQGGQWAHVYIDQGYMTDDMLSTDYLHWLYTALTRATEKVFLVNWPTTQVEGQAT